MQTGLTNEKECIMTINKVRIIPFRSCSTLVVDKIFVFYEFKLPDTDTTESQGIALTHVVDSLDRAGKFAVLFVCRHETDSQADKTVVEKIYLHNHWYKGNGNTVKELTDRFINFAETLHPIAKE